MENIYAGLVTVLQFHPSYYGLFIYTTFQRSGITLIFPFLEKKSQELHFPNTLFQQTTLDIILSL